MSNLIEKSKVPCVKMLRVITADGLGGYTTSWSDGDKFMASIIFAGNASHAGNSEQTIAQKAENVSTYEVMTDRGVGLEFHSVIRRLSDGKIFRITSDYFDMQSPMASSFRYEKVTAEEWSLAESETESEIEADE